MSRAPSLAATLAAAALGAWGAAALGVPAPFVTGPALAVTAASLAGLDTRLPTILRNACLALIGAGMGAGITPEAAATAAAWPLSLAALAAMLLAITAGGAALLMLGFGHARDTAVLAAVPGHLSYVLAMAERLRGPDVAVMAVMQSLRVLALTLLVPLGLALLSDAELSAAPDLGRDMAPAALALVLVGSVALGRLAAAWGLPAAYLLAAMGVSGALHVGGWVEGDVPPWLAVPAFAVMGALIGSRFSGVTPALLGRAAAAGSVLIAVSGGIAGAAALGVSAALGLPLAQTLIAFAPGGIETMAALAILMGVDTAYVAAHHMGRMVMLTVMVPAMMRRRA